MRASGATAANWTNANFSFTTKIHECSVFRVFGYLLTSDVLHQDARFYLLLWRRRHLIPFPPTLPWSFHEAENVPAGFVSVKRFSNTSWFLKGRRTSWRKHNGPEPTTLKCGLTGVFVVLEVINTLIVSVEHQRRANVLFHLLLLTTALAC